ncbi:MAG: repeat-containing protein [Bacillales bacterium]|jgi:tetratricopeptide (TPR) repeat protein|nr:repeat-containing protein [Bacillales bacterium]
MKQIPKIIFIVMLILFICTWVNVISGSINEKLKYDEHLDQLDILENKEIYIDAIKIVEVLLEINPRDIYLHLKHADLNKKLGRERIYIEEIEGLIQIYPKYKEPIVALAKYYEQKGMYSEAIRILKNSNMLKENGELDRLYQKIKGKFFERYESFDDIKDWHNNISFIKTENHWAKISSNGTTSNQFIYQDVGGYDSKEGIFPGEVRDTWMYFNESENRKLVSNRKFDFLGTFSEGLAPVKRKGNAGYINRNFREYAMKFSYTGTFKNGIAAVRDQNGRWGFINKKFKFVSESRFDDIVIDEYGLCSEYGVSFVKRNGDYFLVNLKGMRIGELKFDDVKTFESNQYAAVKIDGKWGFINKKGKWTIKPKFQNAISFTIGLGGVQQNGIWGFIDLKGDSVIEPQFSEVKPFSKLGLAPVREGSIWHFIQLYEYIK